MSAQFDGFDRRPPREEPDGELDRLIIRAIRNAGRAGIIDEHIEKAIGRKHQSVSGNRRHLVERGYVKHNGKYDKTSGKWGRDAKRWVLTR